MLINLSKQGQGILKIIIFEKAQYYKLFFSNRHDYGYDEQMTHENIICEIGLDI